MRTFTISTLGCKVNQYESQQIRELLQQLGLSPMALSQGPDLVVINTCSVTATASAKSRQLIRKIQRTDPNCTIIVCGCLPITQADELRRMGNHIHFVQHRQDLAVELSSIASGKSATHASAGIQTHQNSTIRSKNIEKIKPTQQKGACELPPLSEFAGQTRAFLKVQDGCDGLCAYCIVPKARPTLFSRPVDDVLGEARSLIKAGHKEIVVTGVFLGAYGRSTVRRRHWPDQQNQGLCHLLGQLAQVPGLARIRLSSLEPADITEALLEVFSQHKNILPHLHLSLQSGSDKILKKMCRQYRSQDFLDITERIGKFLDRPALTTDIIVGFPGETEDDFLDTLALAKAVGFAKIHVFPFSVRPGTAAAKMPGRIDGDIIRKRARVLRQVEAQLAHKFRGQFLGKTCEVLIESQDKQTYGRCERYFKVFLEPTECAPPQNALVRVRLKDHFRDGVSGIPITVID
jgi:threonylcarbamoyladenosine tRNA methylthiotransferase MtaB